MPQIMATIAKGFVDPKKLNAPLKTKFELLELCEYILHVAKQMGLRIIGIGGTDLLEGGKHTLGLRTITFV